MRYLLALVLAFTFTSCTPPPPNLSPKGQSDFRKLQVVHQLDALRDAAIAAEATTPQILSTSTTRTIVQAHKSILLTLQATDAGWQATVRAAVDQIPSNLPAKEKAVIQPYVGVIDAILDEVLP